MSFQENVKLLIYFLGGLFLAFILVAVIKSMGIVQSTQVISGNQVTIYLPQILDWLFAALGFAVLALVFSPLAGVVSEYAGRQPWASNNQPELMQTYLGLYLVVTFAIILSWVRPNLWTLLAAVGVYTYSLVGIFNLLFGAAITISAIYTIVHGAKIWAVASEQIAAKITAPGPSAGANAMHATPVTGRFCQKCGNGLAQGVSFCQRCGNPVSQAPQVPLQPPACAACGNSLPPDVGFCPKCGTRVAELTT